MEHIKESLFKLIKKLEEGNKKEGSIEEIWYKSAGEKIGKHTKPYQFKKQILKVYVDEATWVYELSQKYKEVLIKKMNACFEEEKVKNIYFRVGEIKK